MLSPRLLEIWIQSLLCLTGFKSTSLTSLPTWLCPSRARGLLVKLPCSRLGQRDGRSEHDGHSQVGRGVGDVDANPIQQRRDWTHVSKSLGESSSP